ncbi:hypothetical protein AVEN_128244-1 [Araneus ventricosus]|uniref:Tc1-like transposase DDE domain-containing protein n=1 Tax=Araneus ventricosus TaxID=182803 RepID=A0A4Y1ZZZ1_ARAVE|nr:hypothetical protein AVEN_128244-1 [Araneus ventricosus]
MSYRIAVDNSWPWNILWLEEAHFTSEGEVNTQICRIWGTASPNVENTPHSHQRCSITVARYCDLLRQQIIPALQERECLETTVLMQDGAPPHILEQCRHCFVPTLETIG